MESDATYLMWIDCSNMCNDTERLCIVLEEKYGVKMSVGGEFGTGGNQFLRINVACSRELLLEGLRRFKCVNNS